MIISDRKIIKYKENKKTEWIEGAFPYRSVVDYKFTIVLDDCHSIEAGVFEQIIGRKKREKHACISIQAGCRFGCYMCSSGKRGFSRNLEVSEILDQIKLLSNEVNVYAFDLLSFMGIGEPTDNLKNFIESIQVLVKEIPEYSGNIAFSTICIPEKLSILSQAIDSGAIPQFMMVWISLHSAIDEKRKLLMPYDNIATVHEVIDSTKEFAANHTKTEVWINYMIFRGFNDSQKDALSFSRLITGTEDKISIMLTEPNNNFADFIKGDKKDIERFKSYLLKNGVKNKITNFKAAGQEINAACGEFIFTPYDLQNK